MATRYHTYIFLGAYLILTAEVMGSSTTPQDTTDTKVSWETGPNRRGTLSLVWSCIATIFACTWTVLHLNIPGRQEGTATRRWRMIKWMAINILFPEFILSKAICDLRQALDELGDFGDNIQEINRRTKWVVAERILEPKWTYEWTWDVEYPRHAKLLYRLLLLKGRTFQTMESLNATSNADRSGGLEENYQDQNDIELHSLTDGGDANSAQANISDNPGTNDAAYAGSHDHPDYNAQSPNLTQERSTKGNSQSGGDLVAAVRARPEHQHQQPVPIWPIARKWSVFHSYYAQMGGLLYPETTSSRGHGPHYILLTATKLTSSYNLTVPLDIHSST